MNSPIKIPLVECSIQLNFHGDARIDAVRGLFQQEVRGNFPMLFVPNAQHDAPLSLQPYQFSNPTKTKWLKVAINSFCYSTNEYPGWDQHWQDFFLYWKKLEAYIKPERFNKIGIRYVNKFLATDYEGNLPLNSSAKCLQQLQEAPEFLQSASLLRNDSNLLIVQLMLNQEEKSFQLDLDAQKQDVKAADLIETLGQLHARVEDYFTNTISQELADKIIPMRKLK